jgi:hypothetical protein
MGLDIQAYGHVDLIEAITVKEANARKPQHPLYDTDGVTLLYHSFAERTDGMVDGFYRATCDHAFGAGAYSGYNRWREQLAAMVGTTPEKVWASKDKSVPFYELIDFADNEGFIGPKTSAKLHADFVAHVAEAEKVVDDDSDGWFLTQYLHFTRAFEIAARGGVVRFH